MDQIKVLIVDDSALVRQTYKALLDSEEDIKVIGTASDPYIAVNKIQKVRPDVITLDIEMPRMDGLTFLKKLMSQAPMPVIVISNQTAKGVDIAFKALELGAVEVMAKPNVSDEQARAESRIRLVDAVHSAYRSKSLKFKSRVVSDTPNETKKVSAEPQKIFTPAQPIAVEGVSTLDKIIAIGASTGGTEALKYMLEVLPGKMPPILVVQHMPEKFTRSFAGRLNSISKLTVKEAEHNEEIRPNTVYIAPGNYHMEIMKRGSGYAINIFEGELVSRHRPSVDVLFNSISRFVGKKAIGVIMTGMGRDGATGMKSMLNSGAYTIAQDEATSVVFGMPQKAIQEGAVKVVLPLSDIAPEVCDLVANKIKS